MNVKFAHSIMIAMTAAICFACKESGDEPIPYNPEPGPVAETAISFSGQRQDEQAQTRADMGLENFAESFVVYAIKNDAVSGSDPVNYTSYQDVMKGYYVEWAANTAATTATNTHDWEYLLPSTHPDQTIKFWDWSAKAYRFFGATEWGGTPPATYEDYKTLGPDGTYKTYGTYKDGTDKTYEVSMMADAATLYGTDDYGTDDYVYNPGDNYDAALTAAHLAETPFFSRLWFSTGDAAAYPDKQYGEAVRLSFLQPFCRVRFIFTYAFAREVYTLYNISFKPSDDTKIVRKGIVTVSYPLTGTGTRETYSLTPGTDEDAVNKALADFTEDFDPEDDMKLYPITGDGWYTVLPNNAQGTYTLTVGINTNVPAQAKTAVVPANYMQWLPGYGYTYIFKITEEGGIELAVVQSAFLPWIEIPTNHAIHNW